ncbi:hypothetical protein NPIL_378621 [Nephila pilipes]|uniref:Uncharacterized protein n=1 Tax=Nephila pilipes TaxID=299642 RepID=A0A8X6T2X1_NEPPI|nr:hypothetical protein NPIL_378621 [Nephila pilipes]
MATRQHILASLATLSRRRAGYGRHLRQMAASRVFGPWPAALRFQVKKSCYPVLAMQPYTALLGSTLAIFTRREGDTKPVSVRECSMPKVFVVEILSSNPWIDLLLAWKQKY